MFVSKLVRALNLLNPSSHGRLWLQSFARRHDKPAPGVYSVNGGALMDLDPDDILELSLYYRTFEYRIARLFMRWLTPGVQMADIGANVGYYSMIAAKHIGPSGKVWSFEPNPRVFQKLQHNQEINGATNITLHQIALSESDGEITLFCPPADTHGLSSLRNQGWEHPQTVQVKTRRLDDVLAGERVDVIKMDVEGAELLVLKGAGETIRKNKPRMLLELIPWVTDKFGYQPIEIAEMVVSYHPSYSIRRVETHRVTATTIQQMRADPASAEGYFLFEPNQ